MKKMLLVIVIFVSVFTSACMLMRVNQLDENESIKRMPGIPFYCKVNNYYHITRYLQTVYLVLFQYKATNEMEWKIETIKLPEDKLFEVKDWFSKLPTQIDNAIILDSNLKEFREKSLLITKKSFPIELVANLVETKMEVNTSNIYYLNQKMPLIGSSSLETELNTDGTLSKTKSIVEDQSLAKLADFITGAFPFQEFFKSKLGLVSTAAASPKYDIKLSIAPKIFLYTLSKRIDNPKTLGGNLILEFDDTGNPKLPPDVCFEKKEIKPDSEKKDDKPEKKSIGFSGNVTLPDEKK